MLSIADLLRVSEAAGSREGAIPRVVNVPERVSAALILSRNEARIFARSIENPSHTKSVSITVRERVFLKIFRNVSFLHDTVNDVLGEHIVFTRRCEGCFSARSEKV